MLGRKKPLFRYQWEPLDIENYTERGAERGARMEGITDEEVLSIWQMLHELPLEQVYDRMELLSGQRPDFFFCRASLNNTFYVNELLEKCNDDIPDGGYLLCHATTARFKEKIFLERYGRVLGSVVCAEKYFWHRFCAKMPLLKRFYFLVTGRKNRYFSRVEILGRFVRAGFAIVDEEFYQGEFFVLGRKVREPLRGQPPKCGPVIKLHRVGQNGNLIGVYKFRTMYSYSEYLQDYMYEHGGLQEGGKFKEDCRINFWGRILRRTFLDELPMMVNLFKGQVKLVGVRPLSRQYFKLYSPEMQALRVKVKPGLIPPFYYERQTPATIEEVQESERRYIESYLEHPFRTDWRYFWGSLSNIIFRHKKSH